MPSPVVGRPNPRRKRASAAPTVKYRATLDGDVLLDQFRIGPYLNFTYLVADDEGGDGVVIDPSFGVDPVLERIDARRVKVRYILNTHSHPDHVAGNQDVRDRTGAKVVAHRVAPLHQDVSVDDGEVFTAGRLDFRVVHTPGHTPDSVLYIFEGNVATGDTLFVGECGRTDLPGGDPSEMYDSLHRRLLALDDALVVLPGHDYGATPTSTIGRERAENYTLQPRTREEFLQFLRE
jgi:hydroxyacylglutathione hydrolase